MAQEAAEVVAVAALAHQPDRLAFHAYAVEFGGFGAARLAFFGCVDAQVANFLNVADDGFAAAEVADFNGVAVQDAQDLTALDA